MVDTLRNKTDDSNGDEVSDTPCLTVSSAV